MSFDYKIEETPDKMGGMSFPDPESDGLNLWCWKPLLMFSTLNLHIRMS